MSNYRFNKAICSKIIKVLEDDRQCFSNNLEIGQFCNRIIKSIISEKAYFLNFLISETIDASKIPGGSVEILDEIKNNIEELRKFTMNDSSILEKVSFEVHNETDKHLHSLQESGWFSLKDKLKGIPREYKDTFSIICEIYNKKVNYIAYILKYYCSLSLAKRERFFFLDIHKRLTEQILTNKSIEITTSLPYLPNKYKIIPFEIRENSTHTHYYLLSKLISIEKLGNFDGHELNDEKLLTVRVSNVNPLIVSCNTSKISKDDMKVLNDLLSNYHIAYVTYKSISIDIKFHDDTVKEFHNSSYGRPYFTVNKKTNIYTLNCPFLQAFTYFISFKSNYEIINNIELKNKLKAHYTEKLKLFN